MVGLTLLSAVSFIFSAGPIMALGPRWMGKLYGVIFVVAAATIAAGVSRSRMDSAGSVFGLAILWLAGIATIAGIILGLLIRWIRYRRRPDVDRGATELRRRFFTHFQIVALGVIVTYLGTLVLISPLQGRPDLLLHLTLGAMLLVASGLVLRLIARRRPILNRLLPTALSTLAIAIGGTFVAAVAGGALYTQRVVANAEEAAAGRAYCIEVAGKNGHDRAARSLRDLHPFVMTAEWTGFTYLQRHAQLVMEAPVGTLAKPAHWSYRAGSFVPSWTETTSSFCAPGHHFAANLSWHENGTPDVWRAAEAGMVVQVPAAFAPAIVGASPPYLVIRTTAPDFSRPIEIGWGIEVRPGQRLPPSPRYSPLTPERSPPQYGLPAGFVYWHQGIRYTEYEVSPFTRITCNDPSNNYHRHCAQSFLHQGLIVTFTYPPDLLPRWQEMEGRLSELISAWVTVAGKPIRPTAK